MKTILRLSLAAAAFAALAVVAIQAVQKDRDSVAKTGSPFIMLADGGGQGGP